MRREIIAHDQREGKLRQHTDRLEIIDRVVGQMSEQARIDRHAGVQSGLQDVAVRRGPRRLDCTGERTRAGNVLDDEWLAHLLGQLLTEDARDDVGAAAWRRSDDVGDRSRRIILRCGDACDRSAHRGSGKHIRQKIVRALSFPLGIIGLASARRRIFDHRIRQHAESVDLDFADVACSACAVVRLR